MKHLTPFYLVVVCLLPNALLANNEPSNPYQLIDEYTLATPDSNTQSIEDLANYLQREANNDLEKVRAIYVWIAHNISFDLKEFAGNEGKKTVSGKSLEKIRLANAERTLSTKKGVCMGYATLFKALCDKQGIECHVIIGKVRTEQHAWNALKIDKKWYLVDVTWGAGKVKKGEFVPQFNEAYFLAEPTFFVRSHLPNDPMWQLLEYPFSHDGFEFDSTYVQTQLTKLDSSKTVFAFADTIAAFQKLPRYLRDVESAERAYRYGGDSLLLAIAYRNGGNYYYKQSKKVEDKKALLKNALEHYKKAKPLAIKDDKLFKQVEDNIAKLEWGMKMNDRRYKR